MKKNSSEDITTVGQAYNLYIKEFPKKKRALSTSLIRYLLPYSGFGFNLSVNAGESLSIEECEKRRGLLDLLPLDDFGDIKRVLSWQEQVFVELDTNKNTRSVFKCYLNQFLKWCQKKELIKPKEAEAWTIPICHGDSNKRHHRGNRTLHRITNRNLLLPYTIELKQLSEKVQFQLAEFEAFWTDPHYGMRPIGKIVRNENSFETRLESILQIFGWLALDKLDYHARMYQCIQERHNKDPQYKSDWLSIDPSPSAWIVEIHHKYPPQDLQELKIEDLVQAVNLNPNPLDISKLETDRSSNSLNSYNPEAIIKRIQAELNEQDAALSAETVFQLTQALQPNLALASEAQKLNQISAQGIAKHQAKVKADEAAKKTCCLMGDFTRWIQFQHNPTRRHDGYWLSNSYVTNLYSALINLAKFLYKDTTDPQMYPDYQDIPVIMALRKIRNEIERRPEKGNEVHRIKRNPTWQELGQVLRKLLEACAPRWNPRTQGKGANRNLGGIRYQKPVAQDFQRYLVVMFLRLVSPDRQKIIRTLRLHDTLKLCYLKRDTGEYEEAPWDATSKRYQAHYNIHTKLYYLDSQDVKDATGNVVESPQGRAFEWIVFLDATQTKVSKENAYRVPKIYNPELQAWLFGREDYSGVWHNWPRRVGVGLNGRYRKQQFNWCGYVDFKSGHLGGFRELMNPTHDFVFTQMYGKPHSEGSLNGIYETAIWQHLGFRANIHGVRSAATTHYKKKGMTDAQRESLAKLKNHSVEMQDSTAYNKLKALEETELASRMIIDEFLAEQGLDPEDYGLA